MPTRNVVITQAQSDMIEELVKKGRYQNASEVLRDGLRLVSERDQAFEAKLKALREAAQVGLDDIEAGRYQTFDTAEEMDEAFSKIADEVLGEPVD